MGWIKVNEEYGVSCTYAKEEKGEMEEEEKEEKEGEGNRMKVR